MLSNSISKLLSNVGSIFNKATRLHDEVEAAAETEPICPTGLHRRGYDNDLCDSGLLSSKQHGTASFSCWQTARRSDQDKEYKVELLVDQSEILTKSLDSRERKHSLEVDCYNALMSWKLKEQILGRYMLATKEHAAKASLAIPQENISVLNTETQQTMENDHDSFPFDLLKPETESEYTTQELDWSIDFEPGLAPTATHIPQESIRPLHVQ